ncbi:hypothetical protein TL16_g06099 [Triparma laevis f. inornata]|uniref:Inositol polyphosphate-related phosphatase domain-containing protein n=1 Tax=Triparma laevis f. inornata TaxID=1714386 RepID=A0A9W7AM84_9STRA|nr:hypothetical protein TL16_g06099 [Triparma laevis f. inornata]
MKPLALLFLLIIATAATTPIPINSPILYSRGGSSDDGNMTNSIEASPSASSPITNKDTIPPVNATKRTRRVRHRKKKIFSPASNAIEEVVKEEVTTETAEVKEEVPTESEEVKEEEPTEIKDIIEEDVASSNTKEDDNFVFKGTDDTKSPTPTPTPLPLSLSVRPNPITTSLMTYNLAELPLQPHTISRILKQKNLLKSSFLFLSACETENLKPRRTEGSRSVNFRTQCITTTCEKNYTPLAIHSIGGVQGLLLVKDELLANITSVHVHDVACGIGNVVHNKGGIGVWVSVDVGGVRKSILFVCCHLAAHEKNVEDR